MVPEDGQGVQAYREHVSEACGYVLTEEALGSHDIEGSKRSLVSSPLSRLPARTHCERAGGLHGPIAPSAGHEGASVAGCLLPFMVRPRAPSERFGRPSFPTARHDSLSSRSDNFP
jgi:hypothetical protein